MTADSMEKRSSLVSVFSVGPSLRGAAFRENVNTYIEELLSSGKINSAKKAVHYNAQFYAPVVVSLKDCDLIVFSTTSARSDRIKSHQWDAWGIKNAAKRDTRCVLVLPDRLPEKEVGVALKEKEKFGRDGYTTMIDGIISLSELKSFITNLATDK